MTTFTQKLFNPSRLKSFLWRLGVMILITIVSYLQTNLTEFHITGPYIVLAGLILAEITKALNDAIKQNKYQELTIVEDTLPG